MKFRAGRFFVAANKTMAISVFARYAIGQGIPKGPMHRRNSLSKRWPRRYVYLWFTASRSIRSKLWMNFSIVMTFTVTECILHLNARSIYKMPYPLFGVDRWTANWIDNVTKPNSKTIGNDANRIMENSWNRHDRNRLIGLFNHLPSIDVNPCGQKAHKHL